jgi:hypothetical protein
MEEFSSDSNDSLNTINQKLKVRCVSMQPDIFIAEVEKSNIDLEHYICKLKLRDISFSSVKIYNIYIQI